MKHEDISNSGAKAFIAAIVLGGLYCFGFLLTQVFPFWSDVDPNLISGACGCVLYSFAFAEGAISKHNEG